MPAYHSIFLQDQDVRVIGNLALLPLRTRTRGPAYSLPALAPGTSDLDIDPDSESYDSLDEVLSLFRANTFFRNFEIKGPADRLLIYGILFLSEALGKIKPSMGKKEAEKALLNSALDQFAIPGDASFPLNQAFEAPRDRQDAEVLRQYLSQMAIHRRNMTMAFLGLLPLEIRREIFSYVLVNDDGSQIVLHCVQQRDSSDGSRVPSLPDLRRNEKYIAYRRRYQSSNNSEALKWPDHLEEALFKGSASDLRIDEFELTEHITALRWIGPYRKSKRDSPGRNELLSCIIYELTGRDRSPKQISSHLNNLKNDYGDERTASLQRYSADPADPASSLAECLESQSRLADQIASQNSSELRPVVADYCAQLIAHHLQARERKLRQTIAAVELNHAPRTITENSQSSIPSEPSAILPIPIASNGGRNASLYREQKLSDQSNEGISLISPRLSHQEGNVSTALIYDHNQTHSLRIQPTFPVRHNFLALTLVNQVVRTEALAWLESNVKIDYGDDFDALQVLYLYPLLNLRARNCMKEIRLEFIEGFGTTDVRGLSAFLNTQMPSVRTFLLPEEIRWGILSHYLNFEDVSLRVRQKHDLKDQNHAILSSFLALPDDPRYIYRRKKNLSQQWLDEVERAFFEGVDWSSRHSGTQQRHITRNGFSNETVSQIIYELTGQVRCRKSVSSHCQVLRHVLNGVHPATDLHRDDMVGLTLKLQNTNEANLGSIEVLAEQLQRRLNNMLRVLEARRTLVVETRKVPHFNFSRLIASHLSPSIKHFPDHALTIECDKKIPPNNLSLMGVSRFYRAKCFAMLAPKMIYDFGTHIEAFQDFSKAVSPALLQSINQLRVTLVEGYMIPIPLLPKLKLLRIDLWPRDPARTDLDDRAWGKQTETLLASLQTCAGAAKVRLGMRWRADCERFEKEYVENGSWEQVSEDVPEDQSSSGEAICHRSYELRGGGERKKAGQCGDQVEKASGSQILAA
ncbi:MAG: subunit of the Arp2/3 complex [Alectoria sarmentosa]|nr:MAG: subunit of the Arp2/3 complex [Alectoria sarmentosa]